MRFAVDTGGTFTDLVVEGDDGRHRMFKAPTTPADPIAGVLDALSIAAEDCGLPRRDLLSRGSLFIHGTTHAINAIVTGRTARTALLVTSGHRDMLVLREGGRTEPFNFTIPFPDPYVPRALTFEVPERIRGDGSVFEALDEAAVEAIAAALAEKGVEAVAVCLLWSIVNPAHEERVGALLARYLPGVPVTLSHRVNPSIREFRRASSAAVDASLKPLMGAYMRTLEGRLREAGFAGRVLVVTSQAGVVDAADAAETPIHIVNSGPSMAPVAGRWFAELDEGAATAIVADTGGTTYDVSLVRRGVIPTTRETWIGGAHRGVMIGFPWVDVKSIGAGGGSIARVDGGGLLHVGPGSAGAVPGPVAYGRGGTRPTVTDAAVALGHLDPHFFLGGAMRLDRAATEAAIEAEIARPLGLDVARAADAILAVATENMVQAIGAITVDQGIDPREAVLVGGGGAAGLNAVRVARRLGCRTLVVPEVGAALSAAGALMSELKAEYRSAVFATTSAFDFAAANRALAGLAEQCRAFAEGPGAGAKATAVAFRAEARYATQVWDIEVPLRAGRFEGPEDVARFVGDFHAAHRELFAIDDAGSPVEIIGWAAQVTCRIADAAGVRLAPAGEAGAAPLRRRAYFPATGWVEAAVRRLETLAPDETVAGPAIVESSFTTVVIDPGAVALRRPSGSLSIDVGAR